MGFRRLFLGGLMVRSRERPARRRHTRLVCVKKECLVVVCGRPAAGRAPSLAWRMHRPDKRVG